VSEQQAEQTSGEPGSLSAEPAVPTSSDVNHEPAAVLAQPPADAGPPKFAPERGAASEVDAAKADPFKPDPFKADSFEADASNAGVPKPDAAKADAAKADAPRIPGKVMVMSSGERWDRHAAGPAKEPEQSQGMFGKRRLAALAAVVALAAVAGALGGAMATAALGHFVGADAATAGSQALEASVARIDADIQALKTSIERTSKAGMAQFNKTSDRLDKVEKAQLVPAAKLAKLSEAVEKLRAAPPAALAAAVPVAAKEITGSISPPASAPASAPKIEVARLPTVEDWLLRDVANGGALIEGRQGIFEVYAGDPVPGLGRIDAIRRQDGRWVVVTTRGLIVAR
jgi:hypothetical protein